MKLVHYKKTIFRLFCRTVEYCQIMCTSFYSTISSVVGILNMCTLGKVFTQIILCIIPLACSPSLGYTLSYNIFISVKLNWYPLSHSNCLFILFCQEWIPFQYVGKEDDNTKGSTFWRANHADEISWQRHKTSNSGKVNEIKTRQAQSTKWFGLSNRSDANQKQEE